MIQITTQTIQIVAILISLLSLGVAAWLYSWVKSQPSSNARIAEIGGYIRQGANTFLRREYLILARFTAIAAVLILISFLILSGQVILLKISGWLYHIFLVRFFQHWREK